MAKLSIPTLDERWTARVAAISRRHLGVADLGFGKLAAAVARVSHLYTRERADLAALVGDDDALCARLQFFLSRDLLKVHGPVAELASAGAFPRRPTLRVLDLGAGLGATSLGLARACRALGIGERIALTALDADSEALELLGELCADVSLLPGLPIGAATRVIDLRASWPPPLTGRFDLILIGLALNEIEPAAAPGAGERIAERLQALAPLLADDGAVIAIEPALREQSRALHVARDRIVADRARPGSLQLFAPCLGPPSCPMLARERDYCHERVPFTLPPRLGELARAAGLRDNDLTYSYLTLHRQPRSLRELAPPGATPYRVVSGSLPSKGKLELWLCGERSAARAMRLARHESDVNEALAEAERGDLLAIVPPAPNAADASAAAGAAARLRIGPDTQVALVRSWQLDRHGEVADE